MITGDSLEYEFLINAVKLLKAPIGVSVEIGVRRGQGSKTIIDAYRHYFPKAKLYHLGIDPYGNINYRTADSSVDQKLDYTNAMKRDALLDFTREYPEFHLVNLEDLEFFKRFKDGYPVYDENKKLLTMYEVVHFDGPHTTEAVMNEVNFFLQRRPKQCVYIFDDIDTFKIDTIGNHLVGLGFKEIIRGVRKAVYES